MVHRSVFLFKNLEAIIWVRRRTREIVFATPCGCAYRDMKKLPEKTASPAPYSLGGASLPTMASR
jgi:hypothetical protein